MLIFIGKRNEGGESWWHSMSKKFEVKSVFETIIEHMPLKPFFCVCFDPFFFISIFNICNALSLRLWHNVGNKNVKKENPSGNTERDVRVEHFVNNDNDVVVHWHQLNLRVPLIFMHRSFDVWVYACILSLSFSLSFSVALSWDHSDLRALLHFCFPLFVRRLTSATEMNSFFARFHLSLNVWSWARTAFSRVSKRW